MAKTNEGAKVNINKEVLPRQRPYKVRMDDLPSPGHPLTVPIITSDFQVVHWEGEPGHTRAWHFHVPSMYQVIYGLEGEIEFEYKDENDEVRVTSVKAGEVLYIPGGFEHRTEVIGDEPSRHLILHPRVPQGRINALIGEDEKAGLYHTIPDIAGLWYDTVGDQVVKMDEDAVEANPDRS